jgi:succinoglycan biosynthesis protein ExoL
MAGTETARFLERLDIGLMLPEPSASALAEALSGMTSERYAALRGEVLARDPRNWICDLADCRALVAKLERVAAQNGESPGAIAA